MSDTQLTSGVNIRLLLYKGQTISSQSLPVANTEYSVTLPVGTKKFLLKTRGAGDLKVATSTGQVTTNGNYLTFWAGSFYTEESIDPSGGQITLYVSSSLPDTLEISTWS